MKTLTIFGIVTIIIIYIVISFLPISEIAFLAISMPLTMLLLLLIYGYKHIKRNED